MVDPALMRGKDWIRCCLCFEQFVLPDDKDKLQPVSREPGLVWDVCKDCAEHEIVQGAEY